MRSMMSSRSVGLTPAAGSSRRIARRVGHQHAGELEELALAAGEDAGRLALEAGEHDEVEEGAGALDGRALLGGDAGGAEEVHPGPLAGLALGAGQHVLEHGHLGEGAGDLEGPPDAAGDALLGAFAGDVGGADADIARGRAEGAGEEVEERGLAGAVRADQADHLALGEGDRHAVDRPEAAEAASRGRAPR